MCHVIGYAGSGEARTRLVEGLARIGSDAPECSGVCLLAGGGLELFEAVGRTETLRVRVSGNDTVATAGIAHTKGGCSSTQSWRATSRSRCTARSATVRRPSRTRS